MSDLVNQSFTTLSTEDYDRLSKEEKADYDTQRQLAEDEAQASLPYKWRQTLQDVDVTVPVPKGTRGKDLSVEIGRKKLKVGLKGKKPIIDGTLHKDVKVDDSTWTLDDQVEVNIHLEKVNQMQWWDCTIEGHPKTDTTKIVPENSKLSDLDGETRAMVEKMMFDNQQKQLGKPTSDEQRKQEMLAKFQAAHPEMDFSNAKIGS